MLIQPISDCTDKLFWIMDGQFEPINLFDLYLILHALIFVTSEINEN
jgi:hypothetical protein